MAFITNLANVHAIRPVKPIYGWTQATPQSWTLADGETCFPGMLMTNIGKGQVRGAEPGETPVGICSTFQNELDISGSREVAVWVPGPDAILEIQIDATDPESATKWATAISDLADGEAQYVGVGEDSMLALSREAVAASEGKPAVEGIDPVYRLVDVSQTAIQIAGLL